MQAFILREEKEKIRENRHVIHGLSGTIFFFPRKEV